MVEVILDIRINNKAMFKGDLLMSTFLLEIALIK